MRRNDLAARQQRADVLQCAIGIALKLRPLLDPDVTAVLDKHEHSLIEQMIAAKTDDARRIAAQQVQAWRSLRSIIASTVQGEARAERHLKEMIANG